MIEHNFDKYGSTKIEIYQTGTPQHPDLGSNEDHSLLFVYFKDFDTTLVSLDGHRGMAETGDLTSNPGISYMVSFIMERMPMSPKKVDAGNTGIVLSSVTQLIANSAVLLDLLAPAPSPVATPDEVNLDVPPADDLPGAAPSDNPTL